MVASASLAIGVDDLFGVILTIVIVAALLWAADWLLLRNRFDQSGVQRTALRQSTMAVLTVFGLAAILLSLPVGTDNRQLMIGVFGLIISTVIALSSTSFLANVMAGLMLRSVGSFKDGDFVRVGEQFGRVTERGLFHTEIQTEDRDLTTLPNMYLVQNPVTVVRKSGTIVSATLSLGYDVPHAQVEALLKKAAERSELRDGFAQVIELGDYSIVYRVAGFLEDTRQLLSTRSKLRKQVLDQLHGAGIEIVSPRFVNQRQVPEPVIAPLTAPRGDAGEDSPETVIFDKADLAAKVGELEKERAALNEQISALEGEKDEARKGELETLRRRLAVLEHRIRLADEARKDDGDD